MSRTQWSRFQIKNKFERDVVESSNNKQHQSRENDQAKKPMGRKLFSPKTSQSKGKVKEGEQAKDGELVIDNFNYGMEEELILRRKISWVLSLCISNRLDKYSNRLEKKKIIL